MINDSRELRAFEAYVSECSGLNIDNGKRDALHFSLLSRMKHTSHTHIQSYLEFLKHHPLGHAEFKRLISLITINETRFFRNQSHFEALRSTVIPEIIRAKTQRSFTQQQNLAVWSAGCSSGEEPYSIAMALLDMFGPYHNWNFYILGTDISDAILNKARQGIYGKRSLRHTDQKYIDRYFTIHRAEYHLHEDLKNMVEFNYHNLADHYYPQPAQGLWDIIFCRNVLIYFKMDVIKRVIKQLYECLNEGGYLYIGFSESLYSISKDFSLEQIGDTFVYRKKAAAARPSQADFLNTVSVKVKIKPDTVVHSREATQKKYEEAVKLYADEKYERALKTVQDYTDDYPSDTRGYLLAGKILFELGDLKHAVKKFQTALKLNSMATEAHYYLGVIAHHKKNSKLAIGHLKKAIYTDRDFSMAHYYMASIHHALGNRDKALRSYQNTIKTLKKIPATKTLEHAGWLPVKSIIETCNRQINDLKEFL
jgi:chemotaxis protein methyltransferase CheR